MCKNALILISGHSVDMQRISSTAGGKQQELLRGDVWTGF
jgi:hypothetical protein